MRRLLKLYFIIYIEWRIEHVNATGEFTEDTHEYQVVVSARMILY